MVAALENMNDQNIRVQEVLGILGVEVFLVRGSNSSST